LVLLLSSGFAWAQTTTVTAFVNVAVVPMDRERVMPDQTVVVRDGRIDVIGPATEIDPPPGAVVIDGRGRYLLPGLSEMHVHLPAPPTSPEVIDSVLFLFVANGVMVARGMMGDPSHLALRERVASGQVLGPSLYVAGPALEGGVVEDADTATALIREQAEQGFDLIKLIDVQADVYDAIVRTAGEVGLPFAGHVPRAVGIRGAIEAGQTSIEHLDGYIEALEPDESPIRDADFFTRTRQLTLVADMTKIDALVSATRDAGVWNVPTLAMYESFFSPERGEAIRDRLPEVRYLPAEWVEEWVTTKNAFHDDSTRNVMGFALTGPGAVRLLELRRQVVKALHDGGARILVGTDALQLFTVPGFSVHREMELMAASGLSPYEILEAATRNVAEYAGAESEFGTIEVGKRADVLLLDANPLDDVSNVSRLAGVMVRGRWTSETEIQERLEQIASTYAS
jgi:imidazolonepropionase-like amidohydrolase